jgi:hypothetical protein
MAQCLLSIGVHSFTARSKSFNLDLSAFLDHKVRASSIYKTLTQHKGRLENSLRELQVLGRAVQGPVTFAEVKQYLHHLDHFALVLVDFSFVPDGRPPRECYEGHYLLVFRIDEANDSVWYLDPDHTCHRFKTMSTTTFEQARGAAGADQSCIFIKYPKCAC